MKKILLLVLLLPSAALVYAQPGPPYKLYNINDIQQPFNSETQYYCIDTATLEISYALLEKHPELVSLYLDLDHVPAGLIVHGRYIREINIYGRHYVSSDNKHWAQLTESFYDLELLNYLPNLERVTVMGYKLDHRPYNIARTLEKCGSAVHCIDSAKIFLNLHDVEVVHFPSTLQTRSIHFGKTIIYDSLGIQKNTALRHITFYEEPFHELPAWLPPAVESISFDSCDSLFSIQNLELYKNLQAFSARGCFNLKTFPEYIPVKKLQCFNIQLHPENTPDLLAALTGIDTIQEMSIEFYEGMAEMDFKNLPLHFNRLMISGTPLGNLTEIKLAHLQNVGIGSFYLSGKFANLPDVSLITNLNEFHFTSSVPIADEASLHILEKIKNLKKFSLCNYGRPVFPEVFFENNPHLTYIGLEGTDIEELSFGQTVLAELKHLYLWHNMKLEKIPPKTFYPNAWAPDVHGNKKKEYRY